MYFSDCLSNVSLNAMIHSQQDMTAGWSLIVPITTFPRSLRFAKFLAAPAEHIRLTRKEVAGSTSHLVNAELLQSSSGCCKKPLSLFQNLPWLPSPVSFYVIWGGLIALWFYAWFTNPSWIYLDSSSEGLQNHRPKNVSACMCFLILLATHLVLDFHCSWFLKCDWLLDLIALPLHDFGIP